MKCCLSHITALRWLTRNVNLRCESQRARRVALAGMGVPDAEQARRIKEHLGLPAEEPLDVLVALGSRQKAAGVCCHTCGCELPSGSLLPLPTQLADVELFVASPELAFVQFAYGADLLETVYCGMALCSDYRIEPAARGGVVVREAGDAPLTTPARLAAGVERLGDVRGSGRAARALPHVRGRSRSPKESGLAMLFGLPVRLGGFNLGNVMLNERIEIPEGRDANGAVQHSTRFPDLLITNHDRWGEKHIVAVDYDGLSVHSDARAISRDNRRRNELATVGRITHFTITTEEMRDFHYLYTLADKIRRTLGLRKQPYMKGEPGLPENVRRLEEVQERQFRLWVRFVNGLRET